MKKLLLVCALLLAFVLSATALFATGPDLPPRPTVPAPPPGDTAVPKVVGGWLQVNVLNAGAQWSVVQWQDSAGNWNNVESWRGAFGRVVDGVGQKTWWADQSLFGPTLYRWVLYDNATGKVLVEGKPFIMPTSNRQTVTSDIVLP